MLSRRALVGRLAASAAVARGAAAIASRLVTPLSAARVAPVGLLAHAERVVSYATSAQLR